MHIRTNEHNTRTDTSLIPPSILFFFIGLSGFGLFLCITISATLLLHCIPTTFCSWTQTSDSFRIRLSL
ncbi:hypothetical protein FIBSPDRAFT_857360 [Athelia psychrophila]|uniref:Uncharacterized protein n=1 Tax=Athelia psychrophila TaxID=1759441 RepID=A0A166MSV0_9AGAM|nr:hypothetical protein FIBSPDRAFT_857355 [Fibularhizoctonia sp. CBS 109695]KZP24279.1 hypothetical protein FIBSPDRAFT_857360 [Fibularhizoctonia sp. CBS 109695]